MFDIVDQPNVNVKNKRSDLVDGIVSVWVMTLTLIFAITAVGFTAIYFYWNKYPGNASELADSKNKNSTYSGANLTNSGYLNPPNF